MTKRVWFFLSVLLALVVGQIHAYEVGFNLSGTSTVDKLEGETADGCSLWTDGTVVNGSGLVLNGTDGQVTVDWAASNFWQWGVQDTSDEQIYHTYLDDGSPITVTFNNVGTWAASRNAQGFIIRIYQNTDWNPNTFPTIDVTDGVNVLETVQSSNISTPSGTRGFVDTGVLTADSVTLNLSPRDLGAQMRSTFSAAQIILVDQYLAINPDPAEGAETPINQTLSFDQDAGAAGTGVTYNIYFGTDPNEQSPNFYGLTPVKTTTTDSADFNYDPGVLDNSTTYFWRVDGLEPNLPSGPIVHVGEEWFFTTQPASPRIETDPVSMTVPAGTGSVQLSVTGINIDTYQWYKDGVPLSDDPTDTMYVGENSSTLTIFDVQVADEGFYHCEGDNSLQQPDASAVARLLTERLVGWWKFDGDLTDSVQDAVPGAPAHDGTSVDPNYVLSGIDGNAAEFLGDADGLITISDAADFFNFYPLGYTVSAWVNIPQLPGPWMVPVSKESNVDGNRSGYILAVTNSGEAVHTLRQSWNDLFSGRGVGDGSWHQIVATYDGQEGRIYVDGLLAAQTTNGAIVSDGPADLVFGAQNTDLEQIYTGLLDDVRVYSYALNPVDIASLYVDFNPGTELCISFPEFDIAGPDGVGESFRDCMVNVLDFVPFSAAYLECNLVPTCLP